MTWPNVKHRSHAPFFFLSHIPRPVLLRPFARYKAAPAVRIEVAKVTQAETRPKFVEPYKMINKYDMTILAEAKIFVEMYKVLLQ